VKCGGFGVVGGGAPPYLYRIVGGSVPPGMRYSGLGVSGPFPAGLYSLSVRVNDSLGAQVTVGANWAIYGPAKLSAGGACSASANPPFCTAVRWSYSGGHPTVAPKVVIVGYSQYCDANGCYPVPTAPPPQWGAVAKGGALSISAGGVACNAPPYVGYLTLALVDTTACATTQESNQAKLPVYLSNNC
jgi:hypothetical protein